MSFISSVRSRKVKPVNPPVCVDRTAVGITAAYTPIAEITGSATVKEHFPKQEISWIVTILFIISSFQNTVYLHHRFKLNLELPMI